MQSDQRAFALLTLSVFLLLLLPVLVQKGMFMDGMLYGTVAHNQAHGFGTFWAPRFSQLGIASSLVFHEHPPLTFGIQAWWFRIFGDGFWVERLYSLCAAGVTAWLIIRIWRTLFPATDPARRMWWLPVLMWIVMPPVHWSAQQNMQENTMAMFTTAAVLCVILGAQRSSVRPLVLAGVFTLLAALTKGPPGLFPIVAPVLWWVVVRNGSSYRALMGSAIIALVVVGGLVLLWFWPPAQENLLGYAEGRLFHRINEAPTVDYRWRILQHLFFASIGPAIFTGLVILRYKGRVTAKDRPRRATLGLGLIGLSGILPLLLTMVQKSFYMVAALPMVGLFLAMVAAPALVQPINALNTKAIRWVERGAVILLSVCLVTSLALFGKTARDADMLHDVASIGSMVPEFTLVSVPHSIWGEWNLQCYLMRHHFISIDPGANDHMWYLMRKDDPSGLPDKYQTVPIDLRVYTLGRLGPENAIE